MLLAITYGVFGNPTNQNDSNTLNIVDIDSLEGSAG